MIIIISSSSTSVRIVLWLLLAEEVVAGIPGRAVLYIGFQDYYFYY